MLDQIKGLHHVTSMASSAPQNNAFWTKTLGLRRVKQTGLTFREFAAPGTTVRQIFVDDRNGVRIELNWKGAAPRG